MDTLIRTESQEQIAVAGLLRIYQAQGKVICFSKLAQETFTKYISVKRKNRLEGLNPGVPDMLIVFSGKLLFIELKRVRGGTLSPDQKVWGEALTQVSGNVYYTLCKGFDEAKRAIDHVIESG